MKILYDYQAFTWQKFGGVSNSFAQLIKYLPDDISYEVAIKECDNEHLISSNIAPIVPYYKDSAENFLFGSKFRGKFRLYKAVSFLFPSATSYGRNRKYAIDSLKKGNYDVFHPTFYDFYFLKYLKNKPFVLTIHDMIPELFYNNKNDMQIIGKKQMAFRASHIIAVSEKTKKDIIDILGIDEKKITVIHHGINKSKIEIGKPIFNFKYILFVGGRNMQYKNFIPMINNIAPVLKRHQDIKLICTGDSFNEHEKILFKKLDITDSVLHIHCNDTEMFNLYNNAICFIFPSLYEGFGIPILEAYQADCPVLLNKKSCFPEVAKDAAIYFTLDDNCQNLDCVLEEFLQNYTECRQVLLARQQERLKDFSWKKSAQMLANVYRNIM